MMCTAPVACTAALAQGGQVRLAVPLPPDLTRRLCRATQFEGLRRGCLNGEPAEAWLEAAGGTPGLDAGGEGGVLVDGLVIVVRTGRWSFARELPVAALLPWARRLAAALSVDPASAAAGSCSLWLLARPQPGLAPAALPAFRFGPAMADPGVTHPLWPELAGAGDLPVVVEPTALVEALAWCLAAPGVERAGVLLGALAQARGGEPRVWARHFSPAVGADEQATSVCFTREAWAAIHRHRRFLDPALQVVAWVHSHPRVDFGDGGEPTAHFLSPDDLDIMAGFFGHPHCTAWVVDSAAAGAGPAAAIAVYGWDRAGVGLVRRGVDVPVADPNEEQGPS